MASSSRTIKSDSFPPTEGAAMLHAYLVYFQFQEWNTLKESTMDPKDWR